MSDLEQIIEDSVNDSIVDATPELDAAPVEEAETPTEEATPEAEAQTEDTSGEVQSPAAKQPEAEAEPQDPFEKLVGVPQMGVTGRENRIPYSRVKKITEKAVNEVAEAALGRKLNPGERAVDVVKQHVARLPELETKVTEYETRLQNVGQFEQIIENDPQRFLSMLSTLPAYKEFFAFVENAASSLQQTPAGQPQTAVTTPTVAPVGEDMPEPDETLEDGSKVYSMEGLKALLAWNAQQVEARVASKYETNLKQLEERYKPIESEWQERRRIEATLPIIRKQIEEAKTWPLFNENEAEITQALAADPQLSLEAAYRKIVFPKIIADRNKVRQDVIKEVQSAPRATSVAPRVATKPSAPQAGPRSLEDIIKESVETLKR